MGKIVEGSRWVCRTKRLRVVRVLGVDGVQVTYRVEESRETQRNNGQKGDKKKATAAAFLMNYRPEGESNP